MDILPDSFNVAESLDLTAVIAILFIIVHLWSNHLYTLFYRSTSVAADFGGGMAIAYVFIHLLPELEMGETIFGIPLQFVTLLGFLLYYGMERFAWVNAQRALWQESTGSATVDLVLELDPDQRVEPSHITPIPAKRLIFSIQLIFSCTYSFLLVYAMPEEFEHGLALASLYALAMGLHLLNTDHALAEEYTEQFYTWGRYVLIAAVILGFVTDLFAKLPNEYTFHFLIALLAGSLLNNIFQEELPKPENASFLWFSAGVVFYVLLLAGSWQLTL